MRHGKFAAPLLLGLLAGCSLIPTYLRPALPVSAQYPVGANAGEEDYHTPKGILSDTTTPVNYREYSLGVGAVSWELDLFGKIRSQAKAAQETYLSDADTALSVKIALVSEVASAYYTWLADREALKISQDTAAAQEHSLQLNK